MGGLKIQGPLFKWMVLALGLQTQNIYLRILIVKPKNVFICQKIPAPQALPSIIDD